MDVEVKVGICLANFEDRIKNYSNKFSLVSSGRHEIVKYLVYQQEQDGNYQILASNQEFKKGYKYNTIVSVIGPNADTAKKIMTDFEGKISFNLREAPTFVKSAFELMNQLIEYT